MTDWKLRTERRRKQERHGREERGPSRGGYEMEYVAAAISSMVSASASAIT